MFLKYRISVSVPVAIGICPAYHEQLELPPNVGAGSGTRPKCNGCRGTSYLLAIHTFARTNLGAARQRKKQRQQASAKGGQGRVTQVAAWRLGAAAYVTSYRRPQSRVESISSKYRHEFALHGIGVANPLA